MNKPFGDFLFADDKEFHDLYHRLYPNKDINEPNTHDESILCQIIFNWISGEFMGKSKAEKWFKYLKEYEKQFPEFLTPNTNDLYRIEFKDQKWLDYFQAKYPKAECNKWYDTIYRSKGEVQSWTTLKKNEDIKNFIINFIEYHNVGHMDTGCAIVYHSIIPYDQLLFNEKVTRAFMGGISQGEIIRLTNSPLKSRVMIFNKFNRETYGTLKWNIMSENLQQEQRMIEIIKEEVIRFLH